MKNKTEILAPAGNLDALKAAVNAGADAVYMGYGKLNARRNAKNFTKEEFLESISYCKARNVRVNLALNTVAYDRELSIAKETIELAAKAGVDALIVQDMGIISLCKKICPDMPLHASTQLTIHNVSGAKQMKALGFDRVVLAREMSRKEIESIIKNVDIETEVFVHGALCMCVSGQCYMSSVIGERSGNRGLCAQPCRLPFAPSSKSQKGKARNRYALSLKDLSILDNLSELKEMGVTSFKIEGRMKRPEYVYSTVESCRNSLSGKKINYDTLKSVFSRSGFTDGYYYGKITGDMFGTRKKEDIDCAPKELAKITPKLNREYQKIPISFKFVAKQEKPITLFATDGINSFTVKGVLPQLAINKPTNEESVLKSLMKLGGTYFLWDGAKISLDDGLMVPISEINKLRREVLNLIDEKRSTLEPKNVFPFSFPKIKKATNFNAPKLYGSFYNSENLTKEIADKLEYIILPLENIQNTFKSGTLFEKDKQKVIALMPRVAFGDDATIYKPLLNNLKNFGINKLMATNIGFVKLANELGFVIFGGFGLNITNSLALSAYKNLGVTEATLSFELSIPRARDIDKQMIKTGLLAYGNLPLMVTRNCPLRGARGCKDCNENNRYVVDRTGAKYKIICHNKKHIEILNGIPLYLGDKKSDLAPFDFVILSFTDESSKECLNIISDFEKGAKREGITRGLYYRNVL